MTTEITECDYTDLAGFGLAQRRTKGNILLLAQPSTYFTHQTYGGHSIEELMGHQSNDKLQDAPSIAMVQVENLPT